MALLPGASIGPYRVVAPLGAGAMGEVYRARDVRLDRDVAIKVLPASFASDADRVMRFEREAKTLASLNHPHIAQVFGIEEVRDGESPGFSRGIVMELVDGETLADGIARGPISIDEAIPIALQVAEALEAAHSAGIVHRDLKPANIKVRPDGTVKVLDFGLAKSGATSATSATGATGAVTSPAMTGLRQGYGAAGTEIGVILGTAAYMSPEQARGKPVDHRADLWAFGCVIYEMLTGRRAFDGEDTTEILGAIVKTEPDWPRLQATAPPRIVALVRRCLQKDPRRRQQHIGDARIEIEEAVEAPDLRVSAAARGAQRWPAFVPWTIAALATAAVLVTALWNSTNDSPTPPVMRVDLNTPPLMSLGQIADFALSPDGRFIAFLAGLSNAPILVRSLQSGEVRPLPGTEGATRLFWSPDSRSVGFFSGGTLGAGDTLKRIELAGAAPAVIARNVGEFPRAATWSRDGTILFDQIGPGTRLLLRVPAAGGEPAPMTALTAGDGAATREGYAHHFPYFLPDGDLFLFISYAPGYRGELRIGTLSSGTSQALMPLSSRSVQFLPPDRVAYVHESELRVQRIDVQQKSLVGAPETLAVGVPADATGRDAFSVSAAGTVAYRTGGLTTELAWFDRSGRRVARASEPDAAQLVVGARLSPDGTRIALDRFVEGNRDVWVVDVARGSLTRLTADPAAEGLPVWSPDGQRVAYESLRSGVWNLYVRASSGQGGEERLQESSKGQIPLDWSRDGRFLLYVQGDTAAIVDGDLFALPLTGSSRMPLPIATTRFTENGGRFSPDGRWVAYETNQSGRQEILVQPFPEASTGAVQVSVQGGSTPRWSADGRELYFMAPDGTLMVADVKSSNARFVAAVPRALFRSVALNWFGWFQYEVDTADRFLMSVAAEAAPPPIRLLLNWTPRATN